MKDWIGENLNTLISLSLTIIFGVLTYKVSRSANIISNYSNEIMKISNRNYEESFEGQKNYLLNKLSEFGKPLLAASQTDDPDEQTRLVKEYVTNLMDEDIRRRIISVGNHETIVAFNKIKYYKEDRSYKVNSDFVIRDKETGVLNFLVLHFNLVNSVKNSYQHTDVDNKNSRDEVREIFNFYLPKNIRDNEEYMYMLEYSLERFGI